MDTRNGNLYTLEEAQKLLKSDPNMKRHLIEVQHATMDQLRRRKVGRNELCPCGSGKKFKKCCYTPSGAQEGDE